MSFSPPSVYWMIVRGIENSAVTLGELELPPTARLRVYRVNTTLNNGEMVTLAEAPAGTCKVTARAPPRAALHADSSCTR